MNDKPAAPSVTPGAASPGPGGMRRPPLPIWPLTVLEVEQVTPRMRRATFQGETLAGFEWKPAQDVVLMIPQNGGEPARRHYTVRAFDKVAKRLSIDFVLHGSSSPAVTWIKAAKPGDRIDAAGPRGRTVVNPDAAWHLFTGDETCQPGIFAMLEQLPAGARAFAFIEVADENEVQQPATAADLSLEWIVRGGPAKPASQKLIDAFKNFSLPSGAGQAYVIGETSTVRAQRQNLIARGFDKTRIVAEGYWRPGRIGHHDHIWDEGEGAPMPPRPAQ